MCTYLGRTCFCPVLMIRSLSFPRHSVYFDYQTSPPLPGEVVITTPMTPSLKLSSSGWPACWQRGHTWSGGSYLFLAVRHLQRRSQGPKSQIPIFQHQLCKHLLICNTDEFVQSSLSTSPVGRRRQQWTSISLALAPVAHNHS